MPFSSYRWLRSSKHGAPSSSQRVAWSLRLVASTALCFLHSTCNDAQADKYNHRPHLYHHRGLLYGKLCRIHGRHLAYTKMTPLASKLSKNSTSDKPLCPAGVEQRHMHSRIGINLGLTGPTHWWRSLSIDSRRLECGWGNVFHRAGMAIQSTREISCSAIGYATSARTCSNARE
jgi:hypothetical protein